MNMLTIYRSASPTVTVDIDEKTIFLQKLMTEHRVASEFYASAVLDIAIGDYIIHNSENFYVNKLPSITKLNNTLYLYNIDFESVWYELKKKLFISTDGLAEYGYTGTATNFVTNIVANMNVTGFPGGWTVGTVASTDEKTIVFSNESCSAALMKVAETFGLEFSITTKSISLQISVGSNTLHSFTYGKNNGLYKLERQQVSDQNIITRVYGYGSTANIPYGYRDRAKRLVFETGSPPVRYLEKNTSLYGIIEGQYTNNDIYPNRTGTVTAANMEFEGNIYDNRASYVEDSALTFDINDYLIEGMEAMIVFKSGDLSGQEFVIWKYDDTLKRIYFNAQSDEDGYTTPNPLNVAAVGNLYTLVNISLPQSYIDTAETALQAATQAFLDENSVPMVVYSVDIDPKYARTNSISLKAGDRVTIVDSALGIDNLIRISSVEYPLSNVYKIKAIIADHVPYTINERVVQKTIANIIETRIVDRTSDELARRNAMRQRQLRDLIFDSDNYFDPERIRPLSVETMYLSVGAKSQNFRLVGVTIQCNYLGDANRLYCSTGELHHFEIPDENGFDWIIGSAYDTGAGYMDSDTAYYLYAKCYKSSSAAQWELTTSQLAADGIDGYYHFLVGIIYAVYDGVRDYDLTYGMTYINGRTITTGKIQSLDELCYLDLTAGTFKIGDETHSLDWGVTASGQLTLKGTMVQRSPGEYFPITIYRGPYSPVTVYHNGDMVTYNGSTWIYHNETPASGITPVEGEYWTTAAAQGTPGTSPVPIYRGEWAAGIDYYGTASRVDIVHYNVTDLFYIAKPSAGNPFSNIVPTNTAYWSSFGANFESIATKLLFAEFAYLENVGVRYFEGVPIAPGSLSGTVENVQPNITGIARIDKITLTGTSGTANITCNGLTRLCNFESDLAITALAFAQEWYQDWYAIGIMVSNLSDELFFTEISGNNFSGATDVANLTGNLDGTPTTTQAHIEGQKRIDSITLTGYGGAVDIVCDGTLRRLLFTENRTATAASFVSQNASVYLWGDVVVTSVGEVIYFTSRYKGVNFTGSTLCTHVEGVYAGAISIAGNEIWEDKTNSSQYATILINMKGYQGGTQYYRSLIIGNGRGNDLLTLGHDGGKNQDMIYFNAPIYIFGWLPTSPDGLYGGQMYRDAEGFLKIKS